MDKKFKRATVTYRGPSPALRHHCNPTNTDNMFFRGEPLEVCEADALHYATKGGFKVHIEYFPKKGDKKKPAEKKAKESKRRR